MRPFVPSQASSDRELLDYTEDEASLVNEPDQAIKPNHKAIKPSHTATRPSHETNLSQTPEEILPHGLTNNNDSASTSSLYDPTKSSWEPQKGTIYVPRETVSKETHIYSIPSVDCLFTPFWTPLLQTKLISSKPRNMFKTVIRRWLWSKGPS